MTNTNETVYQNYKELSEHEVPTTISSVSEQVMVMEATSSAHSATSSFRHSPSMEDALNADETRSQLCGELNEPEIDIVTGGSLLSKPSWASEAKPLANSQGSKGGLGLSDNTKNWLYPSVGGGAVAMVVGGGGEAYGLYGKPQVMGQKK